MSGDLSSLFLHNRASALDNLQLGGNALRGTFGSEFSELSELRVLNLGNSSVEGKIPSELYRLSKLEHLHLQNANFYGELSEEFRFLNQTIKTINLKGNNFYGDVPKALDDCLELGTCGSLHCETRPRKKNTKFGCFIFAFEEYLDLSDNPGITGRISKSICARRTRTSAVTPFHVVDGIDFLGIPCSVQCNCCGFRDECDEKSP